MKISARKEPLAGWVPQVWIDDLKSWFDIPPGIRMPVVYHAKPEQAIVAGFAFYGL